MIPNLGDIDRIVRLIAGSALLLLTITGNAWGLLGLVLIATGVIGTCPLYRLVGISTNPSYATPKTGT